MEKILSHPGAGPVIARYGREALKDTARAVFRSSTARSIEAILGECEKRLAKEFAPDGRRVVNGTGVLIHTNLGRAPLSPRVSRAILDAAEGYHAVELDLETGKRGGRGAHTRALAARLLSAEDALVVNNNAAAVLLALAATAPGREVLVSRGELVAIGGSFQIPEILETSGARLREVGTTNRTTIADFSRGFSRDVAALLTVHPSNYEIRGYVRKAAFAEIADFCRRRKIPWIHDHGAGSIADLSPFGLPGEERATDALGAGATLVAFSGDKLFGGPQAGILAGRRKAIAACREHPLARAVRADKLTLAGVFASLAGWMAEGARGFPLYALAGTPVAELRERARSVAAAVSPEVEAEVIDTFSVFGGGTTPGREFPSAGLAVRVRRRSASDLAAALLAAPTPVLGRVASRRLVIDFRAIFPEEDPWVTAALRSLGASPPPPAPRLPREPPLLSSRRSSARTR